MTLRTSKRVSTDVQDQLRQWAAEARTKMLIPRQTNYDRARLEGKALKLQPSNMDDLTIIYLHVDKQPDFVWPFTYSVETDAGIDYRYVLFEEYRAGYQIWPQMENRIDWVKLADFKPWQYDSVWGGRLPVMNSHVQQSLSLDTNYELLPFVTQHAFSADKHGEHSIWDAFNWVARRDDKFDGGPVTGKYNVKRGSHPRIYSILPPQSCYHPQHNKDGLWQPVREPDWSWDYLNGLTPAQMEMWKTLWVNMNREMLYEVKNGSMSGFDPDTFNAADYAAEIARLFNADDFVNFIIPQWVWTFHCERETFGGSIDPEFWRMAQRHSGARSVDILLYEKGKSHKSEQFGIFAQEFAHANDPYGKPNLPALRLYETADLILIDGEAEYNCVARTVEQGHQFIMQHDRSATKKLRVITNQTTAIYGTEYRQASFDLMKETGVVFCTQQELLDELHSMGVRYY